MSSKGQLLIVVDLLIFTLLLWLVFGSFKEIVRALYYLIKPNILSIVKKGYDKDFSYTHRFIFCCCIIFIVVLIEVAIFYR